MDLTKYKKDIKTNKIINGETVSYTLTALLCIFLMIAFKQIFKVFFDINASTAALVSFFIAQIISFLLEKRFVFRKKVISSNIKQVLMFIFRAAVNLGFYKLSEFLFASLLDMTDAFVWLTTITLCFFFNYNFDRLLLFDCSYRARDIKYSRIYIIFYHNRFILLSCGIAGLCIAIIYIIYTIFPFGDNTVMRMDLYHQYGPLFAELYDRVINHQSFLYSWTSGGGTSFIGNYYNYLSSPLSALIFLFDKKDISFAISFLVSIKCILSAATFTAYIKYSLGKHSYFSASFGVLYAFSAYFLAYYWNIMWLDGMILLPLILLGIERIVKSGKSALYIASLSLLIFSSYYTGFMTCIFSVIYFFAYYAVSADFSEKINPEYKNKKKFSFKALMNNKFFNSCVKFGVSSILCGGICAFMLIPVFKILQSSSATSDTFPLSFESYFNIFDFITSHLAGLETTIRSSGEDVLPNIYSGMATVLLVPLFIINKDIKFREKFVYVLILIFFLFSFDNNCLNFIWHAFHFPNDLPFRFSYMYSFIMLVISYKCLSKIKSLSISDITIVGMAWVFFIILAQKMATSKMSETTIYISIGFIIVWTGFLYLLKKGKIEKTIACALVVLIVFSEVLIADTASIPISQSNLDYAKNYDSYTSAIESIEEEDDSFYREELTSLVTRMDPCYYGYNGVSIFSSMAYENYSQLQYSLGMFGNRINSYTYNTQTPVYNMMFNIKYLIQTDLSNEMSEKLYSYKLSSSDEKTAVYENNYNLPIAYCVNNNIDNWVYEEGNPFDVQGDFFSLATGFSDVFKDVKYLDCNFDGIDGEAPSGNGTLMMSKGDSNSSYAYADVKFTPNKSGNVYLYVTSPDIESIEISSDKLSSHTQSITEPYIFDLGYYESGDELSVSLDCSNINTTETYAEIYAYSVDMDVLEKGYEKLKKNSLDITSHSDTSIKGTISVDEDGYLYTSIPYDKGWSIYIDGEKADTFELGEALLCTTVKHGEHTVEMKYTPPGFTAGTVISGVTLTGIIGYVLYTKLKKRKHD